MHGAHGEPQTVPDRYRAGKCMHHATTDPDAIAGDGATRAARLIAELL